MRSHWPFVLTTLVHVGLERARLLAVALRVDSAYTAGMLCSEECYHQLSVMILQKGYTTSLMVRFQQRMTKRPSTNFTELDF